MSHDLFKHLKFVRNNTLKSVEGISDEVADTIPQGFRNSIHWHYGHIYYVLEVFSFDRHELPMELPKDAATFFAPGTSPLDWMTEPPTITELTVLLENQIERIQDALENRLDEELKKPFTSKSGVSFHTVAELLAFNLSHESVHFSAINHYKKMLQ